MFSCIHREVCISVMGFSIPWRKCWRVSRQKLPLQCSVRTQRVDCTQAADVFLLNFKATRPKESLARFPNTMQMILNYSENKLVIHDPKASSSPWTALRMRLWKPLWCKIQQIKLLPTLTSTIRVKAKICPTSTANININTPNTLNPTTKVTQHRHKFS